MTPFRILFHWLCAAFAFGIAVSLFGAGEIDVAVPIFLAGVGLLFIDFVGAEKDNKVPNHCAPSDIDDLVKWLDDIGDPQKIAFPSYENTDWRTKASVIARVIRYLKENQ